MHAPLEHLRIGNFQSIRDADLDLGRFTVIIGPSNSGKSAALRALRAVVQNVNSPSAVQAGEKMFTVRVQSSEGAAVIERGKSHSTYRLIEGEDEAVFTKAGREVPVEVQRWFGLPTDRAIDPHFSTQIDPPFLLSESGSNAARVLGELSNIHRLHAGAKEANRRRLEADRLLKIRKDDAAKAAAYLTDNYSDLPQAVADVQEAESLLDAVREASQEKENLNALLYEWREVEAKHASLTVPDEVVVADDLAEVASLIAKHAEIKRLLDDLDKCIGLLDDLQAIAEKRSREQQEFQDEFDAALAEYGWCPTCTRKMP